MRGIWDLLISLRPSRLRSQLNSKCKRTRAAKPSVPPLDMLNLCLLRLLSRLSPMYCRQSHGGRRITTGMRSPPYIDWVPKPDGLRVAQSFFP
ncbi:hypothetical protein VTO73DRAFT_13746 [Trametes versicolor]